MLEGVKRDNPKTKKSMSSVTELCVWQAGDKSEDD